MMDDMKLTGWKLVKRPYLPRHLAESQLAGRVITRQSVPRASALPEVGVVCDAVLFQYLRRSVRPHGLIG